MAFKRWPRFEDFGPGLLVEWYSNRLPRTMRTLDPHHFLVGHSFILCSVAFQQNVKLREVEHDFLAEHVNWTESNKHECKKIETQMYRLF